jgi:hypothetical protein
MVTIRLVDSPGFFRNFSGSFEHDDEDEDDASAEALAKEDLVADFGVSSVERLRRETLTSLSRVAQSNATPRCDQCRLTRCRSL